MYLTKVRSVVDEMSRIETAVLLLPDAKDKMSKTKDIVRRTVTTLHHQCSTFASRKRNVHIFEASVMYASADTRPWEIAVITAKPIEVQRKAVPAAGLGWKRAELGCCGGA